MILLFSCGVEMVISVPEPVEPSIFAIEGERRGTSTRLPRGTAPKAAAPKRDSADARPAVELVLYVSAVSPHSRIALRNLRRALAQFANHHVKLTVHDLSKDPQRAERDGVHFTPALVAAGHGPKTWIVGHLGNPQVLQALIESTIDPKE